MWFAVCLSGQQIWPLSARTRAQTQDQVPIAQWITMWWVSVLAHIAHGRGKVQGSRSHWPSWGRNLRTLASLVWQAGSTSTQPWYPNHVPQVQVLKPRELHEGHGACSSFSWTERPSWIDTHTHREPRAGTGLLSIYAPSYCRCFKLKLRIYTTVETLHKLNLSTGHESICLPCGNTSCSLHLLSQHLQAAQSWEHSTAIWAQGDKGTDGSSQGFFQTNISHGLIARPREKRAVLTTALTWSSKKYIY